jgi:hypothetical protein
MCALILKCNYFENVNGLATACAAEPSTPHPPQTLPQPVTATTDADELNTVYNVQGTQKQHLMYEYLHVTRKGHAVA